jgi:hypothetical protein
MNPAPRKSERIKRPAPPTIVQRTPETSSTSEAMPAQQSYQAAENNTPSLPEQPVDVFTALMGAGMVNNSVSETAPPQVSRRTAPDTRSAPPDTPNETSGLVQQVPDAGSVDADLLSLIDLPPSTPILRQARPEPSVSRAIEHSPEHGMSQPTAFTPPTIEHHTESLDSVMRAETEATTPTTSGTEGEGKSDESGMDVDKLARDVMSVLRRRLRTEHERRGGKS